MPYRVRKLGEHLRGGWPKSPPLPELVRERIQARFLGTFAPDEPPGRVFLQRFCRTVRDGRRPPAGHLLLVAEGLEKVLAGASAGSAFGLNVGKGRKRTEDRQLRDKVINAEVEELRREGEKLCDAVEKVAKRYHRRTDSIKKIYQSHQRERRATEAWRKRVLREALDEK